MKVKILAPHQIIDDKETKVGDTVEIADNEARSLIQAGYAAQLDQKPKQKETPNKTIKEGGK